MTLSRFLLITAIIQEGRFLHFFGNDPRLFLLKGVGEGIPPLFIIQGANDTIILVDGSRAFVRLLLEKRLGQRWS
jgi:hypothetical protein